MATPLNPLAGEWGSVLSRGQARRMSRRFAGVGVGISPARLREIVAGAPFAGTESVDVNFAIAATEMQHDERIARFVRMRRRAVQWLVFAGMVLVALHLLICMAFAFVSVVQHSAPF
jgi:hypothetical protein